MKPSDPLPFTAFDSDWLAPQDRFETWRANIASAPNILPKEGADPAASHARLQGERAGTADIVNVAVPRVALAGEPQRHGLVLGDERGAFLGGYLQALLRVLPALTQAEAASISRITRDLIAVCTRPSAQNRARTQGRIEAGYLRRAKRLIETRLTCPQLSPVLVCTELGISRSALYRLFEPLGGVARYIQARKLDHLHALLGQPTENRLLGELAKLYGFSDGAHLSRSFRKRFGLSPSDVRNTARLAAARPGVDAGERVNGHLAAWLHEPMR